MPFVPNPNFPEGEAARTGWMPTRKWLVAAFSALVLVVGSGIESGFDETEVTMALTVGAPLVLAYLAPNARTPGGVPDAK